MNTSPHRPALGPLALFAALCLAPAAAFADQPAPPTYEHALGDDLWELTRHVGRASLTQFVEPDGLLLFVGGAGIVALLTVDEADQQRAIEDRGLLGSTGQTIGDIGGLVLNFGAIPVGAYAAGRLLEDEKLTRFAMDYTATFLLVGFETFLLSQIPFHERPRIVQGLEEAGSSNAINDVLRGVSSFPSGHMVGVSVLAFKGWEYYGWKVGLPATLATAFVGLARVEEGQHYFTDIAGSFMLAGLASLATSRARPMWMNAPIDGVSLLPYVGSDGAIGLAGAF